MKAFVHENLFKLDGDIPVVRAIPSFFNCMCKNVIVFISSISNKNNIL